MCMEPSEPPKPANLMSDSDLAADADRCRCSDASFAAIRSSNMMQQTKVNKVETWRIIQFSHSRVKSKERLWYVIVTAMGKEHERL